jgi:TATA-binding protein-associated factor Taf7
VHEAAQEKQKIREELSDLKSSLHDKERELERTTNPIANYKAEIKMKEQMLRGNHDGDDGMVDA